MLELHESTCVICAILVVRVVVFAALGREDINKVSPRFQPNAEPLQVEAFRKQLLDHHFQSL
jgi:hypothetical protein